MSKECNFKAVTAVQYCEESVRDAFISGLQLSLIRQRLLENKTLDLATMFDQARTPDSAQKNSEVYSAPPSLVLGLATPESPEPVASKELSVESAPVTAAVSVKHFFCGSSRHPHTKCPAREAVC